MLNYVMPQLSNFKSATAFLVGFYEMNKQQKKFSMRALCRQLNWPSSYFSDVIKSNRNLTIQRAVEFSKYFKFSDLESERFILMAIADVESLKVRKLMEKLMLSTPTIHDARAESVVDLVIFEYLKKCTEFVGFEDISKALNRIDINQKQFMEIISRFEKEGWIERLGNKIKLIHKNSLVIENLNMERMSNTALEYLEIEKKYFSLLSSRLGPCIYNFGFVNLTPEYYKEAIERVLSLRNWFETIANQSPPSHSRLFHFGMNVIPVESKNK